VLFPFPLVFAFDQSILSPFFEQISVQVMMVPLPDLYDEVPGISSVSFLARQHPHSPTERLVVCIVVPFFPLLSTPHPFPFYKDFYFLFAVRPRFTVRNFPFRSSLQWSVSGLVLVRPMSPGIPQYARLSLCFPSYPEQVNCPDVVCVFPGLPPLPRCATVVCFLSLFFDDTPLTVSV